MELGQERPLRACVLDEGLEPRDEAGPGVLCGGALVGLGDEAVDVCPVDGLDHVDASREVAVQRPDPDARLLGDGLHRGLAPLRREHLAGGGDQQLVVATGVGSHGLVARRLVGDGHRRVRGLHLLAGHRPVAFLTSLLKGLQSGGTLRILFGGSIRFPPLYQEKERRQCPPPPPAAPFEPPAPGAHDPGHPRSGLLLVVILTAQLMVVLDTTIVNVALPHVQHALGFSVPSLSWVLNAYLLTFGGLLLLGARAGDLLGRRRVFHAGIAVFAASSLLGGLATTGWALLAARALQGVGAALAAPSALALLTTTFSEGSQRVRAIGYFTAVSAAGGAVGLVAGGVLTELVSWRWVMFVNVPIGLWGLAVGPRVLPETETRHGRFDVAGAFLSTVGTTSLVLGLVEAASKGWGDPLTIGALAIGLAALAGSSASRPTPRSRSCRLRLLARSTRTAANVARGLLYASMYGMFFFLGQYLQDVQGYSPLRAGLAFLPVPASVFLSSQLTSRVLVGRDRRPRPSCWPASRARS